MFLSIKSIIFLNHDFKELKCTKKIDKTYCYYNDIKIYKNAEKERINFFEENKEKINYLIKEYKLPEFNKYTSYYYEVVSLIDIDLNQNEDLYNFFEIYNNSYNIEEFYMKNNLYFEIFYPYKIL